ncbi:hypothetical protein RCL_jg9270.t1 [Rhizophagus clarus]|uniref:Uncharacterized protein n=1 Tax=Rhizophagus clarus TaxID=94130 RepID=A0A8H3MA06_9GLOM|nr:hypothetical protein RCL_jg9270.t1 [Rhizophagus clarus]
MSNMVSFFNERLLMFRCFAFVDRPVLWYLDNVLEMKIWNSRTQLLGRSGVWDMWIFKRPGILTAHENLDLCWIRKLLNLGYMPFLDESELKRVDFYSKIHRMLAFRISKYISILNGLGTSCSEVLELGSISLGSRCGVLVRNGQFFK